MQARLNNPNYGGEPLELVRHVYSADLCTARFWLNESHREELGPSIAHAATITFSQPQFDQQLLDQFLQDDSCYVTQPSKTQIDINSTALKAESIAIVWHDFDLDDYRRLVKLQQNRLRALERTVAKSNSTLENIRRYVGEQQTRRRQTQRVGETDIRDTRLMDVLNRLRQFTE